MSVGVKLAEFVPKGGDAMAQLAPPVGSAVQQGGGVMRWEPIAARLFATGTPLHDIARYVQMEEAKIAHYLCTEKGMALVKLHTDGRQSRIDELLREGVLDTLLVIGRLRYSSSDATKLAACKAWLDHARLIPARAPESPEEMKARIEKVLTERAAQSKPPTSNEQHSPT